MNKNLHKLIYTLIIIFLFLIIFLFIDHPIKRTLFPLMGILGLAFLVIGIILTIKARKEKGKLKIFLMLAGLSAVTPLIFSILHNIFYAMAIIFENFSIIFETLHVISFLIAILIGPTLFIISSIGSLILLNKKKTT